MSTAEHALIVAIAAEVGLRPDDHKGILRAVTARDGAGGELVEIAELVGMKPRHHHPRGAVLAAVRLLVAATVAP